MTVIRSDESMARLYLAVWDAKLGHLTADWCYTTGLSPKSTSTWGNEGESSHCLYPLSRVETNKLKSLPSKQQLLQVGGLDGKMEEGGDNLSVGQRQLFCLARLVLLLWRHMKLAANKLVRTIYTCLNCQPFCLASELPVNCTFCKHAAKLPIQCIFWLLSCFLTFSHFSAWLLNFTLDLTHCAAAVGVPSLCGTDYADTGIHTRRLQRFADSAGAVASIMMSCLRLICSSIYGQRFSSAC